MGSILLWDINQHININLLKLTHSALHFINVRIWHRSDPQGRSIVLHDSSLSLPITVSHTCTHYITRCSNIDHQTNNNGAWEHRYSLYQLGIPQQIRPSRSSHSIVCFILQPTHSHLSHMHTLHSQMLKHRQSDQQRLRLRTMILSLSTGNRSTDDSRATWALTPEGFANYAYSHQLVT